MAEKNRLTFIKEKVSEHKAEANDKILWSLHAVKKLRIERLRKKDVEVSLRHCSLIEDYPVQGRPFPDCLVLSYINNVPVHIVVADDLKNNRIIIVTVYKPSKERWRNDWKTRKK